MGNHQVRLNSVSLILAGFGVLVIAGMGEALAQSSLGIGRAEPQVPTGGLFEGFFNWVRTQQAEFNQTIKTTLVAMRKDGAHFWSLVGIAFTYGVFHAVGPGHGKVVVSSYMLANEVALRRGVMISMAASIAQGITAITAITVFMLALRGIVKTDQLTFGLELASYIAVMGIGLWLLWRKLFKRSHSHTHRHEHDHVHAHSHDHSHDHHHHHHDHEHMGHGDVCDHCGHAHMPDPKLLEGNRFGLREAWSTILAVGLRPCTGALIILVFCFANGLYLAGILSTLAMSIGTGIAVSTMAILAVTAKNVAIRISGFQDKTAIVHNTIEIVGASLIFVIGLVLFYASVTG